MLTVHQRYRQTYSRTDGRTTYVSISNTALCTLHRAIKIELFADFVSLYSMYCFLLTLYFLFGVQNVLYMCSM